MSSGRDALRRDRSLAVAHRQTAIAITGMLPNVTAERLRDAVEAYQRAQDELFDARNRLARTTAGAAMSGITKDEILPLTG
jgi:hypothetical protein